METKKELLEMETKKEIYFFRYILSNKTIYIIKCH
mgnify:CR=1 FL=1